MTTESMAAAVEAGAAVFELERFEWTAPDRIELTGVWTCLRARRFIRPTLVLETAGGRRRLLALLEHKPWSADDGADWIAAFAWTGEAAEVEAAQLNVASGMDIELPPPRRATGKRPPRRFRHRAVSRDASREDSAAPVPSGVVAPPAEIESPKRVEAEPTDAVAPEPTETVAPEPTETVAPEPPETVAPEPTDSVAPEPTETVAPEPTETVAPEPAAVAPEPAAAAAPKPSASEADTRALEGALERASAAELRVRQLVGERDEAVARRKALAAELSELKQSHERALSTVRAEERESATRMLAEGAELRASVERERDTAYAARDTALRKRDEAYQARDDAVKARELALEERKQAIAERKSALRARDKAFSERDRAVRAREEAIASQEIALDERDEAKRNRDMAYSERDGVISAQQRGLPVIPAQPRHLPPEPERSPQEVWTPRAIAAGALAVFLLVLIKLFAGL